MGGQVLGRGHYAPITSNTISSYKICQRPQKVGCQAGGDEVKVLCKHPWLGLGRV